MNTPQDGGPIAASIHQQIPMGENVNQTQTLTAVGGLSIRDWFAGMALQGMLAHSTACSDQAWKSDSCAAEWSYQLADAMLAAREAPSALEE